MSGATLSDRVIALAVAGVTPARVARTAAALSAEEPVTAAEPATAEAVIDALERAHGRPDARREALTRRELASAGAQTVVAGGPGYPSRLARAWPDLGAPLWLFARTRGDSLPDGPTVAVVGTRHPTVDGLETASALGACLARAGVIVVSGLARGIDQAAHQGALDAGGRTVGVLGAGFGVDYPKGDGPAREAVAAAGGLVTELLPGTPPRGHQFLSRNRIIAGLADAVVIVEGRLRSGALATAQRAAELGREVLACPGSINSPRSRAPLALIRDGATVLTRVEDAVEAAGVLALEHPPAGASHPREDGAATHGLSPAASDVLGLLGPTPADIDRLARASGRGAQEVVGAVAELSTRGLARRSPAGIARVPRD